MKGIAAESTLLVLAKVLLNNQLTTTENSTQRTAWIILALAITVLLVISTGFHFQRDPYTKGVLALRGDSLQGQVIFQLNCAGCHGIDADGQVGPSLRHVASRKSRVGLIAQVTSGKTPPMPQFQPTPQEMADLLGYLESL